MTVNTYVPQALFLNLQTREINFENCNGPGGTVFNNPSCNPF